MGNNTRLLEKTLAVLLVLSVAVNILLLGVILAPGGDLPLEGPLEVVTPSATTLAPASTTAGAATMQVPVVIQRVEGKQGGPFPYEVVTTEGGMVNISVEVAPGKGRVLVQTTPLMGTVFQDAANHAVAAAANHSGVDLSGADVIFSIRSPEEVSEIDGPSAGAAMAALLTSVLEGFPLNESVTVTGTIDENGRIGPIGGVLEKAEAAYRSGKTLFLLPAENNQVIGYREEVRLLGNLRIVRQLPVVMDAKTYLQENLGIQVRYVDTLDDLLTYLRAPGVAGEASRPVVSPV
jgi:predicted S18 family serine protease